MSEYILVKKEDFVDFHEDACTACDNKRKCRDCDVNKIGQKYIDKSFSVEDMRKEIGQYLMDNATTVDFCTLTDEILKLIGVDNGK